MKGTHAVPRPKWPQVKVIYVFALSEVSYSDIQRDWKNNMRIISWRLWRNDSTLKFRYPLATSWATGSASHKSS